MAIASQLTASCSTTQLYTALQLAGQLVVTLPFPVTSRY